MFFDRSDGEKILRDSFAVIIQKFVNSFFSVRIKNQADMFRFVDAIDDFFVVIMRCVGRVFFG